MYQIIETPNYYAGTWNAPVAHLVTEREAGLGDTDEIAHFATRAAAESLINDWEYGMYHLQHGEAGRPDYTIIKDLDYEIPDCIRGEYPGEIPSRNVPRDIKEQLDEAELDCEMLPYDTNYWTFAAYVEDDEKSCLYGIKYTVYNIALQVHTDDLSGIDWAHPVYTKEDL